MDILKKLQEEEMATLDGKKYGIEEKYLRIPATIAAISKNMEIDPDLLVRLCASMAVRYKDLEWNDIMEIVYSFHLTKKRIENK